MVGIGNVLQGGDRAGEEIGARLQSREGVGKRDRWRRRRRREGRGKKTVMPTMKKAAASSTWQRVTLTMSSVSKSAAGEEVRKRKAEEAEKGMLDQNAGEGTHMKGGEGELKETLLDAEAEEETSIKENGGARVTRQNRENVR
jgi:hypothetical protein